MTPPLFICVGSLTIDSIVAPDGKAIPRLWGGNVVYAAVGARMWSDRVGIVSRVGNDYPTDFLELLMARGIDTSGVSRVEERHGMNVAFFYRANGNRQRGVPREILERISEADRPYFTDYTTLGTQHRYQTWFTFSPDPSDIPRDWLTSAHATHLAAMPVQRHLTLAAAMRNAKSDRCITLDSPWYDEREPNTDFHTPLFPLLDAVLPSEADLRVRMRGTDPLSGALQLARQGARSVIVKLGSSGCLVLAGIRTGAWRVPAYPTQVVDPTGAGDAFCGGFLVGLAETRNPLEAASYGTVSASFVIEGAGILHALPVTRRDAEARLASVRAAIRPWEVEG